VVTNKVEIWTVTKGTIYLKLLYIYGTQHTFFLSKFQKSPVLDFCIMFALIKMIKKYKYIKVEIHSWSKWKRTCNPKYRVNTVKIVVLIVHKKYVWRENVSYIYDVSFGTDIRYYQESLVCLEKCLCPIKNIRNMERNSACMGVDSVKLERRTSVSMSIYINGTHELVFSHCQSGDWIAVIRPVLPQTSRAKVSFPLARRN
jgi:hypothetical protein